MFHTSNLWHIGDCYLRLFILIAVTLSCTSLSAIDIKAYEDLDLIEAGTPSRIETEFKFAFVIPEGMDPGLILKAIKDEVDDLVEGDEFKFPIITKEPFYTEEQFQEFVFKDIYIDTSDLKLFRANSAYRLRYRWPQHTVPKGSCPEGQKTSAPYEDSAPRGLNFDPHY